jgi:uncharacterized DUF497 family protein
MYNTLGGKVPEFDWDHHNERHLARHNISRSDAEDVLSGNHVLLAYQNENREERWTAVGVTRNGRVLVILFATRDELIRPITGWIADEQTAKLYFEEWGTE